VSAQVQAQYRSVSTVLKRVDAGAKSPLFSHFKETPDGVEVRSVALMPPPLPLSPLIGEGGGRE